MRGDLTGTTIGHYSVGELLGRGAMGEVYQAQHTTLQNPRAIKRLNPDLAVNEHYRRAFLQEGRHAARLSHHGIASVYDTLEWDGELLLVMEYVEGRDLCDVKRPMPIRRFLDFSLECVSAVAAAHRSGIVHRDLKPANIRLTWPDNRVKILDFGVAKRLPGSLQEATTLFDSGGSEKICGTLPYMAPEVLMGDPVDQRADIFSLGIVFYELLAGNHPFRENTPTATIDRILHHSPISLPAVDSRIPEEIDRIITKMLRKKAENRYATADDLLVDLRQLCRAKDRVGAEPGKPSLGPVPKKRSFWGTTGRYWLAPAILVILLIASTVAVGPERLWWMYVNNVTALPEVKTLAITPFQSASAEPADRAFAAGISRELGAALARTLNDYPGLEGSERVHVIQQDFIFDRTEFRFMEVEAGAGAEILAKETGATMILFGSLLTQSDETWVEIQILDGHFHPKGGKGPRDLLRGDRFVVADSDPLLLLREAYRRTVEMIGIEVPSEALARPFWGAPRGEGTYAHFLRGSGYFSLSTQNAEADLIQSAIDELKLATTVEPRFCRALCALGKALLAQERITGDTAAIEDARNHCSLANQVNPELVEPHVCLAEVSMAKGQYDRALMSLRKGESLKPACEEIVLGLVHVYDRLNQPFQTESVLENAIRRNPGYWLYLHRLGEFLYDRGRFSEAIPLWKKASEMAPCSWLVFRDLGLAYSRVAEWEKGRQALEKALELDPADKDDRGNILTNLGTAYFFSGRLPEAVRSYERAIEESEEGNYHRTANLADALYFLRQEERAKTLYRQAIEQAEERLEQDPQNEIALRRIAKAYAMLGNKTESQKFLARALKISPEDPNNMEAAAEICQQFGETDRALEWLGKALDGGIHVAEIRNHPIFEPLEENPEYRALFE